MSPLVLLTDDDQLADLLRRTSESVPAFVRGDMRRWHELQPHSGDYTLMPPNGGVRHGFDSSDANLDALPPATGRAALDSAIRTIEDSGLDASAQRSAVATLDRLSQLGTAS